MTPEEKMISSMKRGVTFVCKENQGVIEELGTGFFYKMPLEEFTERTTGYLVTAKHVLKDETGNYLDKIFVRLNKKQGGTDYLSVELKNNIFTHSDESVDLAVIPCLPSTDIFDYSNMQSKQIGGKDLIQKNKIIEGDNVFFVGLFLGHKGQKRNIPIFRYGKVALLTDEKISWKEDPYEIPRHTELHLIDCQTFDGNSGSPVFFSTRGRFEEDDIPKGPEAVIFAGVICGSYNEKGEVREEHKISNFTYFENQGISAVTPAYKLKEIIFSDQLKNQRKMISDELKKEL